LHRAELWYHFSRSLTDVSSQSEVDAVRFKLVNFGVAAAFALNCGLISSAADQADYPIRPVAAHHVQFTDAFWQPRLEVNRTATIPYSLQSCEETGRIENFKVAAGTSDKKWTGRFGFNDSDLSKIIEGASYSLMTHPDPRLAAYVDEIVGYMAAAQEDDGYLYTTWTAKDKIDNPANIICCYPKKEKWLEEEMSHELYNLGHMYEAATAHYEATGQKNFLDVATKSADLLVKTFGPGKMEIPPGHEEVEIGLVKLYRVTGDQAYLDLAKYFVDLRGHKTDDRPKLFGEYSQDHKPLREQEEAVGHSVRAMYLYAGAADVAALTNDQGLTTAVDRIWDNVVSKKTYVTGGIGAKGQGEAFGANYELPNRTAYCETCANLATCYWNNRMFLLHGDAKYIDVLERALYNSVISGVSLDGKEFFYPNPLSARGDYARSKWFDCSCCPTNLCRFIPSVPGYAYAVGDDAIYVNLFAEGTANLEVNGQKVRIDQRTKYPWDGNIELTITPEKPGAKFELYVRVPGWARGEAWPSDLYAFEGETKEQPSFRINGSDFVSDLYRGYVLFAKEWQPGDKVSMKLPMPVRRVIANEKVEADRGRVALMRGPMVFCIEGADVEGGKVNDLVLSDDAPLQSAFRNDLLGGVQVITGAAQPQQELVEFTAIPYYAWANRGKGEMAVWLARTPDAVTADEPAETKD
jgi:DUF1680 family protein